ncbi:MAG: M56 family metallopeptidase [Lachnospiraceae bacterium]|nr:M56 family metallopeptidase [Lachnospiraceae bacterium]
MLFTVFSVIMSIVCSSIILFAASFLISHARKVRWGLLLLIIILGFARLVLPFEFFEAKEINSWRIFPMLRTLAMFEFPWGMTLGETLGFIWQIGIGVLLIAFLWKVLQLNGIVARAKPSVPGDYLNHHYEMAARKLGYSGNARIAVTEDFSTAVSVGILHPVILIPRKMVDYPEKELQGVIRHELTHYLRGDVCKQWTLNVVQCLFWWNPVVHYLKRSVEEMLEMECDERTCRGMDEEERLAYLEAIRRVLTDGGKHEPKLGMGYGKNHAGEFMKRRFLAVLEPVQKQSNGVTYLLAFLSVVLFCLSYSFVLQTAGMPKVMVEDDVAIKLTDDRYEDTECFLLKMPDGSYLYVADMIEQGRITEKELLDPPYYGLPTYEKLP